VEGFVAWMERSEIRGRYQTWANIPDYAALHPGYAVNVPYFSDTFFGSLPLPATRT
jgi:hypothetical protein